MARAMKTMKTLRTRMRIMMKNSNKMLNYMARRLKRIKMAFWLKISMAKKRTWRSKTIATRIQFKKFARKTNKPVTMSSKFSIRSRKPITTMLTKKTRMKMMMMGRCKLHRSLID